MQGNCHQLPGSLKILQSCPWPGGPCLMSCEKGSLWHPSSPIVTWRFDTNEKWKKNVGNLFSATCRAYFTSVTPINGLTNGFHWYFFHPILIEVYFTSFLSGFWAHLGPFVSFKIWPLTEKNRCCQVQVTVARLHKAEGHATSSLSILSPNISGT